MGSGTANLEASLLGRHSIGVDVDPFSRFLATVKTAVLPSTELKLSWQSIRKRIESYSEPSHFDGVPEFPYRDNWFKPYILKELAHIKTEIEKTDTSQSIKDFFLVCFSSIIRQVSEADNNCTRTVVRKRLEKQVLPNMAIDLFIKRANTQVENMRALSVLNPSGDVFIPDNADAREMPTIRDASIDLALTSPPYANAVDYPRTHQLEIYWLGFANGSLQPLKKRHVGTEVVRAKDYSESHKTGCKEADTVIAEIYKIDPRRAYIATKYLWDMYANLKEVYRVLRPGAVYALVVGYNASRVDLPHSTYDIVVERPTQDIIRVQVKTVGQGKSVSFTGGVRSGVDRTYKSDVKSYTQNTKTSDIVVGVESIAFNGDKEINFYFVPTLHIEKINQKSLSVRKIPQAKNDWEILLRCKEKDFVDKMFG